jgi:hypothetical protein
MDTWTYGHRDSGTHGHMDTGTQEHMDTWTRGHLDKVINSENFLNQLRFIYCILDVFRNSFNFFLVECLHKIEIHIQYIKELPVYLVYNNIH